MSNNAFFLVWNPSTGYARHRHVSSELAVQEAERLARANPGSTFYTLQALSISVEPVKPKITTQLLCDEIPF